MKVGDLVKYKYINGEPSTERDIGIIIDTQSLGLRMLVEWNNGTRLWRHVNVLEVICK